MAILCSSRSHLGCVCPVPGAQVYIMLWPQEHTRLLHLSEMAAWLHRRGKSMPVEDLTDDQKHDIRECFELFDADHSGALDVDEVLEACEVLGLDAGGSGGGGTVGHSHFTFNRSAISAPCSRFQELYLPL